VLLRVRKTSEMVRFEVVDEGEGILRDVAAQARAPFFTPRGHAGGTGLGRAIANEIIQQHRGPFELLPRSDVEPGQRGPIAVVELPRTAVASATPDADGEQPEEPA
jgi:signal transduction histidine kinase